MVPPGSFLEVFFYENPFWNNIWKEGETGSRNQSLLHKGNEKPSLPITGEKCGFRHEGNFSLTQWSWQSTCPGWWYMGRKPLRGEGQPGTRDSTSWWSGWAPADPGPGRSPHCPAASGASRRPAAPWSWTPRPGSETWRSPAPCSGWWCGLYPSERHWMSSPTSGRQPKGRQV